jgi:hypothetical protein
VNLTCSRCSRINPAQAVYCYFDGSLLQGLPSTQVPTLTAARPFPAPFVFPNGRACQTFDQLALACQENWSAALELLRQGLLERFLRGLGRADLAAAAQEAARFPDRDRGLDQFLAKLPAPALKPPKLLVEPREVQLGTLPIGKNQRFELRLKNQGMRLLYGSVDADSKWLVLGDGAGSAQKLFQFREAMTLSVQVRGQHLRASNQPLEARLVFESNGGTVTLVVRAKVPVQPFPEGVLAGSTTPRQLADKARAAPRDAAIFFEKGMVVQWYRANGWTYPVQGPAAAGLAALQQFFEALGLSKPPRVELCTPAVHLRGKPGETLQHALELKTEERRPIWAQASSNQPWLSTGPSQSSGSAARIPLEVRNVPPRPGEVLQARVSVTANGAQRFEVPVTLTVAAAIPPQQPAALLPVPPLNPPEKRAPAAQQELLPVPPAGGIARRDTTPPAAKSPLPAKRRRKTSPNPDRDLDSPSRSYWPVTLGLLFVLALGGAGAWVLLFGPGASYQAEVTEDDSTAQNETPSKSKKEQPAAFIVAEKDEPEEIKQLPPPPVMYEIGDAPEEKKEVPLPVTAEIKDEPEDRSEYVPPPVVPPKIEDGPTEAPKAVPRPPVDTKPRIVYKYGREMRFGVSVAGVAGGGKKLTFSDDGGTNNTVVRVDGTPTGFGSPAGRWVNKGSNLPNDVKREAWSGSKCEWAVGKVHFTQILELVPSKQPVKVGGVSKRLLETCLVRYIIENKDKQEHQAGVRVQIDTLIGTNDGVPFTVPGLPGLVNTFKDFTDQSVPDFIQALEKPDLLNPGTVAHMTFKVGGGLEAPRRVSLTHWPGSNAPWDVPVVHMGTDSAVIMYWDEKPLKPKERREVGFAYGLGGVAVEAKGSLGVILDGEFEPGKTFSITAYVSNPAVGETLTLALPEGLQRIEGKQKVPVPPPGEGKTSVITWKAKVLEPGQFPIKVKSTTGASVTKTVTISRPNIDGGKVTLELKGPYEPGKEFTVIARVKDALPDQSLTLQLPDGLQRTAGNEKEPVAGGEKDAVVTWSVKVLKPGKFSLRVKSSTGVVYTKTLTITQASEEEGKFALKLLGQSFEPGKEFEVLAIVSKPRAKQTLTLKLPKGLTQTEGEAKKLVPAPEKDKTDTSLSWKVRVEQPGKFAIKVQSSTGVTQTKTLTITRPDLSGGKFTIALSGSFEPGKQFDVKTKVVDPLPGQTLTLLLPEGLELVEGTVTQTVGAKKLEPDAAWKVKVQKPGKYSLKVESSTGVTQTKTISIIRPEVETGGEFNFTLEGSLQPRESFTIIARVTNPRKNQTLTLQLSEGLKLLEGEEKQAVPRPAAGEKVAVVTWRASVQGEGSHPVGVESSTGITKRKTINVRPKPQEKIFK